MLDRTTRLVASSSRVVVRSPFPAPSSSTSRAGGLGHLGQRLAHGGQRRPDPAGERQVVEADHAQVLRDAQPQLAGGLVQRRAPGGRCPRRWPWAGPGRPQQLQAAGGGRPRGGSRPPGSAPGRRAARRSPAPRGSRRARARAHIMRAGPPMTPIRRWPRSVRCRVAARPPCQLVAPTEGTSSPGSPAGSITTNGMERLVSWARWDASRPDSTRITPCGRRAGTPSAQVRPGVSRPGALREDHAQPRPRGRRSRRPGRPPSPRRCPARGRPGR